MFLSSGWIKSEWGAQKAVLGPQKAGIFQNYKQ